VKLHQKKRKAKIIREILQKLIFLLRKEKNQVTLKYFQSPLLQINKKEKIVRFLYMVQSG
jgi:hypothetical protein